MSDKRVVKNIFRLRYSADMLHIFQIIYLLWVLSSYSSLFPLVNAHISIQFPSFTHHSCLFCSLNYQRTFVTLSTVYSGQLSTTQLLEFILLASSRVLPLSVVCVGLYEKHVLLLGIAFMLHISKLQTKQGCSPKLWLFQICF